MAVTNRGSILISTANDIGSSLVDVIGGEGYTPNEWAKEVNLCGIAAADIPTALENIEESTPSGTDRGSISLDTANAVGAVLNKKFNTARGFKPSEWASAISFLEPLPERTASGGIANIQDGADKVPIKSWQVTLPASLDGYSEVNGVRYGKNLLNSSDTSHTFLSGTNTQYQIGNISLKGGVTYTFSAKQEDDLTSNTRNTLVIYDNGTYTYEYGTGTNYHNQSGIHSVQYTPNEDKTVTLMIWVHTPSNDVTYSSFMVEVGSFASSYEPYTAPEVSEVDLGRTIYGGTADIVNGQGTDENGNDFAFTPIDPIPETENGVINFWSDEGDSSVVYRADIDSPDPSNLLGLSNSNDNIEEEEGNI